MTFPPFPPFPAYGAVYGGGGGRGRGNFVPLFLFQLFFTYKYLGGHMGRGGRGDGYGGWGWGGWGGAEGAQWTIESRLEQFDCSHENFSVANHPHMALFKIILIRIVVSL